MGSFMTFKKLGLGKKLGVIEGVDFNTFHPNRATVGVGKASGGIVYFNVKGCRINATTESLEELNNHVGHLGSVRVLTNSAENLFEGAKAGQQVPWKGMVLQEYHLTNGTVGYVVLENSINA